MKRRFISGGHKINRSALIRVPQFNKGMSKAARIELRCPDPSCNPYLAFAGILAAGLEGVELKMKPPKPLNNINVYELNAAERKELGISELPGSLIGALEELEKDDLLKDTLGETAYQAFRRAKLEEWEEYRIKVMDWELEHYLETA